MKLLVYSAKDFEIPFLEKANQERHKVFYTKTSLDPETAVRAVGHNAISIFSGDDASSIVLEKLWDLGVRYITLRSAGHNNINLKMARRFGFKVANAPDYSPHAIAEHAIALLLALNRKIIVADRQVHDYNFLQNGLTGFNLNGKTAGLIGTGKIGSVMAKILYGFGCKILAYDINPNIDLIAQYGLTYTSLNDLCKKAHFISLHLPLAQGSHHMINKQLFDLMNKQAILINTSRGGIVQTKELIIALESKKIAGYCTDVYEKERGVFFKDHSKIGIQDEQLKKLLSLPNVLLTPHQGFITTEALANIADTTFENLNCWEEGRNCKNELG